MSKITVSILTVSADLPAGVTAGELHAVLADSVGNVVSQQNVENLVAVFTGVADGSYNISVMRLDSTGATLGTPITQSVQVGATPVPVPTPEPVPTPATYAAPSSMTITVEAE